MNPVKVLPLGLALVTCVVSAQEGPGQPPNVILQNNRSKNEKDANTRVIDGIVKDAADNPLADAIVQLKDMKTSKLVSYPTKEDGKYVFRDLPMDINYELTAKRNELSAPVKKVSVFDTRKHVIVNFELAPAKP